MPLMYAISERVPTLNTGWLVHLNLLGSHKFQQASLPESMVEVKLDCFLLYYLICRENTSFSRPCHPGPVHALYRYQ